MTRLAAVLLAILAAGPAVAAAPAPVAKPATPAAKPDALEGDRRSLYAAGLMLAGSLEVFSLSEADLAVVLQAVKDGVAGKPAFEVDDQTRMAVQALARQRMAARTRQLEAKGDAYRATAAAAPGAVQTASGLVYQPLAAGTGAAPAAADTVKVRYTGRLVDGTVFDATDPKGEPATFKLDGVVPCWSEGLQRMKAGGKARLVCPPALAYGDRGVPGEIPAGATLDFEVELVAVEPAK
jgi:FKBP-type peptidyl-prolyl cis-trans isomerase FkpA